ncbi:polyprenyl synthetase family protein [Streptomyces lacrimifluminis]|uniref:Geranylgeranyl pyrophosphate synthase n=1 Tax=Streptomyces lacrimifluminis TaxID=1500077 RepID=A0A917PDN1_9ACTN|nr:polyprenyl synthetase family protein [Streptomyces lacrimifluminis]GGJ72045.1 geranylgeranyl pyrophosphate synthase [Streptomyces lacrimifluminis]
MASVALDADPADLVSMRGHVTALLAEFLDRKARTAAAHELPSEITETLRDFLLFGGKLLRPLLCVTGWHAAGSNGGLRPVLQVAASLEMFHAFALIHDDLMDDSATRRGRPTVHRVFTARHTGGHSERAAAHFGAGAAILIGDLALAWSDELLHTAGLAPRQLACVLPHLDAMRTEVMYGQYLDLLTAGRPTADVDAALTVVRYKTAKYTLERPLHLGAALAGADRTVLGACTDYALPLGEAYQLRDDLLGVFGSPAQTGKSALDDLRDAKATVLIALALQAASPAQADRLRALIGNPRLGEDGATDVA